MHLLFSSSSCLRRARLAGWLRVRCAQARLAGLGGGTKGTRGPGGPQLLSLYRSELYVYGDLLLELSEKGREAELWVSSSLKGVGEREREREEKKRDNNFESETPP